MNTMTASEQTEQWRNRHDTPGWAIDMVWRDLLFMHWPIDADQLQSLLPSGLEADTHDGKAWIGLVPFTMDRVRMWSLPRIPGFTRFHECNVRTYVKCNGVPGVWFFSLDAANPLAVWTARLIWKLNYVFARFKVSHEGDLCTYTVKRPSGIGSRIQWRVGEELPQTSPGSIEHFLTERYCLYSASRGRVWRGVVHHDPWQLCEADVPQLDDRLVAEAGLEIDGPPLCHAARPVHVHAWPIKRIK
tara:strand:- start:2501 stop:3235 length:735 start_codon:yes stop_codon:yes gene_type:complete